MTRRCAGYGLRFARLAEDARRAYDEAKRVRGGLDFDDLLVKTRDLLRRRGRPPSASRGSGVEFVLVDEFQDTDPVQSEILRSLGGDGFATGRLFVVGDFKQSIYRFRGARPQLFQDFRGEFPDEGRHDLTENFRSARGVIDFVNALFAERLPGREPPARPRPALGARGRRPGGRVRLGGREPGGSERGRGSRKGERAPTAGDADETEARVARPPGPDEARRGLAGPRPGDEAGPRAPRQEDVAFLFRAMTDLAPYENALQAEGLDFHVVGGKAFYAQQEVLDLVNVLSVIEDPLDAVALAGALRGPFFGLSDDALFRLGGSGDGRPGRRPRRSGALDRLSDLDRRRAARAHELARTLAGVEGPGADRRPGRPGARRVGFRGGPAGRVPRRPEAGQRPEARPPGAAVRRAGRVHPRPLRPPAPRRPPPAPARGAGVDHRGGGARASA